MALQFNTPKDEKVRIDINGVKYDLPADLDVEEQALMLKLVSFSNRLESQDESNPDNQLYEDMANVLLIFKNLFRVYNPEHKVKKLRLSQSMAMEIFTEVYQKNA